MHRRSFLRLISISIAAFSTPAIAKKTRPVGTELLLQSSPIAGFQYHQGEIVWAQLHQGTALQLTREPENKYDSRAVRIDFNGQKLGYIPRLDNAAVSQLLDRGETLQAHITNLQVSDNPWERVEVEVRWLI